MYFIEKNQPFYETNCVTYLQMTSINKPNVYIRDSVRVREKLKILYEGGPEKLQVCVS